MASQPNRVYPMNEYREVITDVVTSATGSFTNKVSAARHRFSTTYTLAPSGSMASGEVVLVTGSSGTSAALWFAVRSGSGYAMYALEGVYQSSGSNA